MIREQTRANRGGGAAIRCRLVALLSEIISGGVDESDEELGFRPVRLEIRGDTDLLEIGAIDSTTVLELVGEIESTFEIAVPDDDLIPDNFATVENLARYVSSRRPELALGPPVEPFDAVVDREDLLTRGRQLEDVRTRGARWMYEASMTPRQRFDPPRLGEYALLELVVASPGEAAYLATHRGDVRFVWHYPERQLSPSELETLGRFFEYSASFDTHHELVDLGDGWLSVHWLAPGVTLRDLGRLFGDEGGLSWPLAAAIFTRAAAALRELTWRGFASELALSPGQVRVCTDPFAAPVRLCGCHPLRPSRPRTADPLAHVARLCADISRGPDDATLRDLIGQRAPAALDVMADYVAQKEIPLDPLLAALLRGGSRWSVNMAGGARISTTELLQRVPPAEMRGLWDRVREHSWPAPLRSDR